MANPDLAKRIADGTFGDPNQGRVKSGWLLMARSGQTYGIIGTVVIAGHDLEDKIISDHVMRIRPRANSIIPPGYLAIALSHPTLGRPLVKSLAYGSSIPEIEVDDLLRFAVPRLAANDELAIGKLAMRAAQCRSDADEQERGIARDADSLLSRFIAGESL